MSRTLLDTQNMAMFCDFENVALGVKESNYDDFDIGLVLEKLLLKGSIVVKKAYCDWHRYRDFKGKMHQASFELIEVPHVRISGKNSADIRMVVDALDLCYTKAHVDCFVIVSGDSDFSPLVSKLRENNKTVIGVGVKNSTSDLLIANCDEFIFYDDLVRAPRRRTATKSRSGASRSAATKDAAARDGVPKEPGRKDAATAQAIQKEPEAAALDGASTAPDSATQAAAPKKPATRSRRGRSAASKQPDAADASAAPDAIGAGARAPAGAGDTPADKGTSAGPDAEPGIGPGIGPGIDQSADQSADPGSDTGPDPDAAAPRRAGGLAEPRAQTSEPEPASDERTQRGLDLIVETLEAILAERGEDERVWGSMIKQTLKRRNPGFNELYYGYRSFNRMLEEARDRQMIALEDDGRSGGYVVRAVQ
ncbi:MAG: NYN domain-containing protein [Lautropia sp.]